MRAIVEKVRDAIAPMRYNGGSQAALYWFIRIGFTIVLPVLVVSIIGGVIYCKVNGIEIKF